MSEVERTLSEQECAELETLVETWHSLDQRFKLTITEEGNEISSTPSLSEVVAGLQILVAMQSLPNLLATVRELRQQLADCQASVSVLCEWITKTAYSNTVCFTGEPCTVTEEAKELADNLPASAKAHVERVQAIEQAAEPIVHICEKWPNEEPQSTCYIRWELLYALCEALKGGDA